MTYDIPFIKPVFPSASTISGDFASIVESNWFTNFGPREREFASSVAGYVGEGMHAATFSNATIALMASLEALLGPGDGSNLVIVPSYTFAAGPEAIEWAGYQPVFIDIDIDTLQPSLESADEVWKRFGDRIVGILLGNTFGIGNPRIAEWERFAADRSLPLVIDSAAGFGSLYGEGERLGARGLCEVFSFHATKPFAIGEGGAAVSRDPELVDRVRSFSNFGFAGGVGAIGRGLNGKMQELNAAIGLRQLESFEDALRSRRDVLTRFRTELPVDRFRFPLGIETSSVCFASVVVDSGRLRDALAEALREAGVEARTYYAPPVHVQPYFAGAVRAASLANTEAIASTVLSLPVHQNMAEADIERIVDVMSGRILRRMEERD